MKQFLRLIALLLFSITSQATTYFISTTGSDGAAGTSSGTAWATFSHANAVVVAGDTVRVLAGTYTGDINVTATGTSSNKITWTSDTPLTAHLVGTGTGDNSVTFNIHGNWNVVANFDITGSDAEGIQDLGSNNTIKGNFVHDIFSPCDANGGAGIDYANESLSQTGGVITGNYVSHIFSTAGCTAAGGTPFGIYLTSPNATVTNNVVVNSPGGIQEWHAAGNETVENNTIICNNATAQTYGVLVGSGDFPCTGGSTCTNGNSNTHNNIVVGCTYGEQEEAGTNGAVDVTNHYFNNDNFGTTFPVTIIGGGSQANNITTDPRLKNQLASPPDVHLTSTSPAIDAGFGPAVDLIDFDGNTRPHGAAWDIGAYEFTSGIYYVSTTGSDSNSGSSPSAAWATFAHADAVAISGDTVRVIAGTYVLDTPGQAADCISTASNGVNWVSDTNRQAKIVCQAGNGFGAWKATGVGSTINGFDITSNNVATLGLYEGTGGSSIKFINNYVHDMALSGSCSVTGNGIAVQDSSASNILIDSNLVVNFGPPGAACSGVFGIMISGQNNTAQNNIVINSNSGIQYKASASNSAGSKIVNNTLVNNRRSNITVDTTAPYTAVLVENNIIYNGMVKCGLDNIAGGTITINTNLFFGNSPGAYCIDGVSEPTANPANQVYSDAIFVNYQANGTGDYHVVSTSPAIGAGTVSGAPVTDYDGNLRPGTTVDIGAYQFTSASITRLIGSFKNPDGTGVQGTLYLSLTQQAAVIPSCGGPYQVVPTNQVAFTLVNGFMPVGAKVVGTNCLTPSGVQYNVSLIDTQGNRLFSDVWVIQGSTEDVGVIVDTGGTSSPSAFALNPLLLNPISNQVINGGFSLTLTGPFIANGLITANAGISSSGPPIFKTSGINNDITGELVFAGSTTAFYSWANLYTMHPECSGIEPQFDPGSGVRSWVTYTGVSSFTIHFSSAVTGTVSYTCTGRL